MKLLRPIFLFLVVVLVVGVVVLGLALVPSVQRWAVLRVAAKQPALHFQMEEISADFSHIQLRGVKLEHRGVRVSLAQLSADYSLRALLFGRRLELGQMAAQGLWIDATAISPQRTRAGLAAAPAAAPGMMARVRLPWNLSLDGYEIQGRILLSGATGQPPLQGEFQLRGGLIGPGREGKHQLRARMKNTAPGAEVGSVEVRGEIQLRESRESVFDYVNFTSWWDSTGPRLAGANQLKLQAEMNRAHGDEKYHFSVATQRDGQSENLLTWDAVRAPTGSSYSGEWNVNARSAQLEPFLLGHTVPKFTAHGAGRFDLSPEPVAATLQGSLQAEVSEFEKLLPEMRVTGPMRVNGEFDLAVDSGNLQFRKLAISLAGSQPVLEIRSTGPLNFDAKLHRIEPANAGASEVLNLKLTGLPVGWLAPFCSVANISGGMVTGEVALVQGDHDQYVLQTSVPLQAEDISVARAGRILLAKASVNLDAAVELTRALAVLRVRSLSVKSAAGDVVQSKFVMTASRGMDFPLVVEGEFATDLPGQPGSFFPAGPMKAKGALACTLQSDRLEVRRFSIEATDAGGDLLGALAITHPFSWDLAHRRADTGATGEVALATLRTGQLPLLAIPTSLSGYSASGRLSPSEATLFALDGKLSLRASAPISITDFSLKRQKSLLLDRVKVQLQPAIECNDGSFSRAQSGEVSLRTGSDVVLAGLNVDLVQSDAGMRAVGTFNLDLPAWSALPGFPLRDALSSGQMKGEVRAAFSAATTQLEARATFANLIASESGQTLPVANLSLRADVDAAGHFSLQAPLLLDRAGQRSDLSFTAEGALQPQGLTFTANLRSEHVEFRDLLMWLAVAGSPLAGEGQGSTAALSRAISPPSADLTAFWSGKNGQLALDCKSIVNGSDWTMTGLTGQLTVNEESLQLEKLESSFEETSRFSAKGALTFDAGLNPYRLAGNFSLTDFDAGRFFKGHNPDQPPMLEGLCTIKAELTGQGLNFDDTLDRTRGSYDLASRQGIFRGLRRSTDKPSMATKAVVLVSSLLGDKSAEKLTGNSYYIEQLAPELSEISFDQFTARLIRDADRSLKMENVTLIAQQIHLAGSGQVTYAEGQSLLEQPLDATLSLRGRGKVEEMLGKLKALDGTRDELGYAKTKEDFTFAGTLAKPDTTAFYVRVAEGKQMDASAPEAGKAEPAPANVAP